MTPILQTPTGRAAVLMLSCMALIGLIDNFVRLIAEHAGLWQFHFTRSIIGCATLALLCQLLGWRLRPHRWGAVALRSALGGIAMAIYFGALGFLPIAQVGAGLFTAPLFVLLFSVMLFRRPVGWVRILAAIAGFGGVSLVLRPFATDVTVLIFVPVVAGVFWSLTALTTKHLCDGESTAALLFGFFTALGLIGAVGLIAIDVLGLGDGQTFVTTGWVAPSQTFWVMTLIQAFGSLIAIGALTRAYQIAETSYVAVFEYSFLIFATFWGWVLLSDRPDFLGAAGLFIIMLSGAVIALRAAEG